MNTEQFIKVLFARALESGITECEAYCTSGEGFSVDVLDGAIKEYAVSGSDGLCLRGLYKGSMGYASTEVMDEDAIELLIDGVKSSAELIESDDNETLFEGSASYPEVKTGTKESADLPASEKIRLSIALEEKVKALDPRVKRVEGCGFESVSSTLRIVNTKGLDLSSSKALIGAYVAPIVIEDGKTNFSFDMKFSGSKADIDLDKMAAKAVNEAVAGLGASSIPSGEYRCVLRYDTAATLLSTFAGVFSGESARKGMSLLKGKEGTDIASPVVTLIDDPLLEGGFATRAFDCEGVASSTHNIIENGRLVTLLHNRTTARLLGCETTGNAAKAGFTGKVQVAPSNFFIKPSATAFDELISAVGNGIMITSLMGMHSGANGITGDFSLGAKGYMIENGRLGKPIEQITIAANFFDVLKQIRAVADDLTFARPGSSSIGCPTIDIGLIKVAGL